MYIDPTYGTIQDYGQQANPILAALSGASSATQPAPAPVPGQPAAASPAPAGGGLLSHIFGGGSANSGMGNPIGNALMGHGNFLVPLRAGLLGGRTPEQQRLAAAQAAATATGNAEAQGFAGLDEALTAAKGNPNRAIHTWMQTPAGHDFFVRGGKMSDVKTYLESASPEAGATAEQKNFEYMLKQSGVDGDSARRLAAKNKLGLLKVVPRTTTNAEGVTVPTGDYDVVDITNGSATKLSGQNAPAAAAAVAPTSVPNVAPAASPPSDKTAQTSGQPGPVVPFGAEIAESVGPVGGTIAAGGSLLSNAVPGAYPAVTQTHRKQVDQIEADAADLMNTFKRGGRGDVVKPLLDLTTISKAASPQEAVSMMINGRQWMEDQIAQKKALLADPKMANTQTGKQALEQLYALQGAIAHIPPMTTQTLSDGTKIMGLQEEAQKLGSASNTSSPAGQYLGDIPGSLERIWNAGKDFAGEATGASEAKGSSKANPIVYDNAETMVKDGESGKLKPGTWVQYTDPKTGKPMLGHIPEKKNGKH
jgi:hypothetical protein